MSEPATDDYRWLVGREAAQHLNELAGGDFDLVRAAERLRKDLSPLRTALLLEQAELRRRAVRKFAAADRMFFAPRALQQATGEAVGRYKALRFGGYAPLGDLCCGIGGDLLALAARADCGARPCTTKGVDRDPVMAILAEANARALGVAVVVDVEDVTPGGIVDLDAWHIDPDRRPGGRRTTTLELHEPDLGLLDALLQRNGRAAVKLAPATRVPEYWQEDAELEWISWSRECRQQVAWFGDLATEHEKPTAGLCRATRLGQGEGQPITLLGHGDEPLGTAQRVARYVFEPDPSVLAARLTGALAARHSLEALAPGVVYLTGDRVIGDPLLTCYEVEDVLPFDRRRVKRLLKERQIGHLVVKKRGVDVDPQQVARQLQCSGDRSATLLLTRIGGTVTAIVARPVASS